MTIFERDEYAQEWRRRQAMTIFEREPARIIGLVVTIALGVVSTLYGEGIISDVQAGTVTDIVHGIAQLVLLLSPLIAGELIRGRVSPVR